MRRVPGDGAPRDSAVIAGLAHGTSRFFHLMVDYQVTVCRDSVASFFMTGHTDLSATASDRFTRPRFIDLAGHLQMSESTNRGEAEAGLAEHQVSASTQNQALNATNSQAR